MLKRKSPYREGCPWSCRYKVPEGGHLALGAHGVGWTRLGDYTPIPLVSSDESHLCMVVICCVCEILFTYDGYFLKHSSTSLLMCNLLENFSCCLKVNFTFIDKNFPNNVYLIFLCPTINLKVISKQIDLYLSLTICCDVHKLWHSSLNLSILRAKIAKINAGFLVFP